MRLIGQDHVSWGTCGATDRALNAAAGHSAAIAMQPGPNEAGTQLRLKRICHSEHMRCDRGASELDCHRGANSSDEVGR